MRGQPTNSAAQPRFLMCRPRYYAVSYSINPWMDPQDWAAQGSDLGEAAHREWAALHAALVDKGATIECLDPKPDLPDLVFTANAAIVLDGKALLARFGSVRALRRAAVEELVEVSGIGPAVAAAVVARLQGAEEALAVNLSTGEVLD